MVANLAVFPALRARRLFLGVVGWVALAGASMLRGATAQVDVGAPDQLIRGFGGATVFMPTTPLSPADLDSLFGNGPGQIGFTLLRIRVASDDAWRAIELANAQGAIARGASVIATPWSPPAAMKDNGSLVAGSLLSGSYPAYAAYLNSFAGYMADNGAPLYAISVQNEPDISVTYESCDWTPAQMLEFCRSNAGAISATRVIMPESFQFRPAMSDPVLNDDGAASNIDIVGGHIYGAGLAPYPLAAAKGKELWMTEHLDLSTDWTGALGTAKEIHDCLATANFNAYFWWYLKRYYGPLGEDGVVTKRGYVMAQFTKFIRPGFVRIDATGNPSAGVYVSAFKRDQLVIVAINQNPSDVTQSFSVVNGAINRVTPWLTSGTANLAPQPAISVAAGVFSSTLPAQSVTTFVGDLVFAAPTIIASPSSHLLTAGTTVELDVAATGENLTYQWSHDGVALPGATDALLSWPAVQMSDAGRYTVTVSNSGGSVTSSAATLAVTPTDVVPRLTNLSTRSLVGAGDAVQIAGFVINGPAAKRVLIRAAGPALGAVTGLSGCLADPMIEVHDAITGAIVASDDDWDPALDSTFTAVAAFPWVHGSKDAAVLVSLPPGPYTAIVSGKNGGTGLALVEIYDAEPESQSSLVNLSTRSLVGAQDGLQIGGFVIRGTTAKTVVLRASGPSLRKVFGMAGTLANPIIELRRQSDNQLLAISDDWNSDLAPHFAAVGAFSWLTESKDAALLKTLEPGAYSVLVRGNNSTTGIALVEVYEER